MSSPWQGHLERKVLEVIQGNIDSIVNEDANDYVSYVRKCAYISGLKDALKLADEVDREVLGHGFIGSERDDREIF